MVKIGGIYNFAKISDIFVALEQVQDITFLFRIGKFETCADRTNVLTQLDIVSKDEKYMNQYKAFGFSEHFEKHMDGYLGQVEETVLQMLIQNLHKQSIYKFVTKKNKL